MSDRSCLSIVLAAGLGTRMRSSMPKVMHEIGNLPLVGHVLKALSASGVKETAVVVGPDMPVLEKTVANLSEGAQCFTQVDRLGTAHAALAAREALEEEHDDVLILFGDTPLITTDMISEVRGALAAGADLVVVGFETANPFGYGRLLMKGEQLLAIREEKDASDEEREVTFCNSGIMGFAGSKVLPLLNQIGNDNANGEYYLTDAVELANAAGLKVVAVNAPEEDLQGINTRAQLSDCEAVFQKRKRLEAMARGVTLLDPASVYFSHDTQIAQDVVVDPNVVFGPGVRIETGSRIRAFSHLEGAVVGADSHIGPYARLRPGTNLEGNNRVGNFVEMKNAAVETGAKVNHLSYVGDASVGARTNIGAGTITCNYDGFNKHKTEIGSDCFVGSNSTLVAPVTLGDGAFIAAGSTITKAVSENALAVGRSRQSELESRAKVLRSRFKAQKQSK